MRFALPGGQTEEPQVLRKPKAALPDQPRMENNDRVCVFTKQTLQRMLPPLATHCFLSLLPSP